MFLNRVSRGIILPLVENVRINKYAQQHAASDISNKFVLFSLLAKFGISVRFSAIHTNYYSAWQYVTKGDSGFIQSFGHPDLTNYHQRTNLAEKKKQLRPCGKCFATLILGQQEGGGGREFVKAGNLQQLTMIKRKGKKVKECVLWLVNRD